MPDPEDIRQLTKLFSGLLPAERRGRLIFSNI